jgi:NDP-sugar pyrophosphorylase family protein
MSTKINHALIMAAGRGLRMMPLTAVVPKPMAPYKGSTLIACSIKEMKFKIENIHVTVGYKGALLAEHVLGIGVQSIFDTNQHGNAWWIYNTLMSLIDEPILVLTADNIGELDFSFLAKSYQAANNPACMVVPVQPIDGLDGDFVHHSKGVVDKLDRNDPTSLYCSGIQILNPKKICSLTKSVDDFGGVWDQLIKLHQLSCSAAYPKKWNSIDTLLQLNNLDSAS